LESIGLLSDEGIVRYAFLDGVYLDRSAQGLKPKFVKLSAPSDADIAAVVTKISQRVIRKLRQLG